jgi:hypothetical protein
VYLFVYGKQAAFYHLYSFNHMPVPFQDLGLFLILFDVHPAFILKIVVFDLQLSYILVSMFGHQTLDPDSDRYSA